jgi:hypothetical protein
MAEAVFESAKTHKKYAVVKFDREAGKVTLRGESGTEFTEKYKPELFRQMGYELKVEG